MKTDLDHVPKTKKRELARIVEILFAEFEAAFAGGTADQIRAMIERSLPFDLAAE